MRVLRVVTGVLAGLLGLLAAVAGGVAAFALIGPGDVLTAGTHHLTTGGVAIATSPDLIRYYDARLVVTAEPTRRGQPVFVGVGNRVDVRSYLTGSAGAQVVDFGFPSTLRIRQVTGAADRHVPPDRLGWWVAEESGSGARTLSWRLADGPYDVVVMNADGRPGVDVRVTAGVELPGAHRFAVGVLVVGLVLLAVAAVVLLWGRRSLGQGGRRARPRLRRRKAEDDDELLWEGREAWEENEYWAAGPSAERPVDERPSWVASAEARSEDGAEPSPADEAPAGEAAPAQESTRSVPAGPRPGSATGARRTRPGWESTGDGGTSAPASPALPWRPGGTRRPAPTNSPPAPPSPNPPGASSRPDRLHDGRPGRPDTWDSHHIRDPRDPRDRRETGDGDDQRQ